MAGFLRTITQLLIGTEPVRPAASMSKKAVSTPSSPHPSPSQPTLASPAKKKHKGKRLTERELIQRESEIGARIFGEPPAGCRREFFNLDPSTWIWYEESVDTATHQRQSVTIRYEIHDQGILKVQEGARYNFLEGQELVNFMAATQLYHEQVTAQLYRQ